MAIPELQHAFLRSLAFLGSPFLRRAEPSSPNTSRGARPHVGIRRLRAQALTAEHFTMCWSELMESEGSGGMGWVQGFFLGSFMDIFLFSPSLCCIEPSSSCWESKSELPKRKAVSWVCVAGILASCTTWGDLVCQTEKSPTPVKWQEYLSSIGGGKILTASKAVMLLSAQIYTSCQD